MEKPLVSVLLASYNHERYVENAVRSVMAEKGVPFELIVIDDGSSDNSPEILERLSHELSFTFITRPNKGLVATLNEMVSLAKGKYFCSFSSDDVMVSNRLKLQSDFLESHPDVPACFGQAINMDEFNNLEPTQDPRYSSSGTRASFEDLFLGRKELHGCSEMISKEKFLAVGGYDSRFKFEDFPLWLSLSFHYGELHILQTTVCYYRIHENSMHRNLDLIYSQVLEILSIYKEHPLYVDAVNAWKANWFSSLAYEDKFTAFCKLPKLASFSFKFIKRLPKLFIPKVFLRY